MKRAQDLSKTNGNIKDSFLSPTCSSGGDPALLIAFCLEFLQAALTSEKVESLLAESHAKKDSA